MTHTYIYIVYSSSSSLFMCCLYPFDLIFFFFFFLDDLRWRRQVHYLFEKTPNVQNNEQQFRHVWQAKNGGCY